MHHGLLGSCANRVLQLQSALSPLHAVSLTFFSVFYSCLGVCWVCGVLCVEWLWPSATQQQRPTVCGQGWFIFARWLCGLVYCAWCL